MKKSVVGTTTHLSYRRRALLPGRFRCAGFFRSPNPLLRRSPAFPDRSSRIPDFGKRNRRARNCAGDFSFLSGDDVLRYTQTISGFSASNKKRGVHGCSTSLSPAFPHNIRARSSWITNFVTRNDPAFANSVHRSARF